MHRDIGYEVQKQPAKRNKDKAASISLRAIFDTAFTSSSCPCDS